MLLNIHYLSAINEPFCIVNIRTHDQILSYIDSLCMLPCRMYILLYYNQLMNEDILNFSLELIIDLLTNGLFQEDSHFRGSILLGLMYCPSPDDKKKKKTCLKLKVVEARDLPLMDNNRTNPYAALLVCRDPELNCSFLSSTLSTHAVVTSSRSLTCGKIGL